MPATINGFIFQVGLFVSILNRNKFGFTIVELLIVIVIIGILAAISIVAYSGITSRAVAASVESDLANASKKIKMFYAENSVYPTSISDCPSPSSQNLCLKPSSGNSFSYSPIGSSNFYLKSTNTNGVSYYTNNDSSPSKLATAPMSPTSDWVVVPQGDHYGNFYNLISGQFASVNRATDSTIYDAATERIYTVPANYLGVNYKNNGGKRGYEATIEDPKTNYVLRSSFENSMAGWTYQFNGYGGAEVSGAKLVHGSKSLAVSRTAAGSEANVWNNLSGLANSTTYYYSAWTWSSNVGGACLYTYNATTNLGSVCNSGNSKWERIGGTFVSSAAGGVQLRLGNDSTGTVSYFDAVQVEQGNYPTSYIFTEDTIATRNSSVVTIPTVSSFSGGTVFASIDNAVRSNVGVYTFGVSDSDKITHYTNTPNSIQSVFNKSSVESYAPVASPFSGTSIAAWRWNATSSKQTINNYHSTLGTIPTPNGSATLTYVGCYFGGAYNCLGAPIQRIITYPTFLSDSDVTSITNSIKDGI